MTDPTPTDFRALCARMADELDHYRQLLMDDRRATHALAAEARAALEAQAELEAPIVAPITRDRDETGDYFMVQDVPVTLMDRVAKAIYDAPNTHEGWRSEARAAILEVAAWLREQHDGDLLWASTVLERQANR